jgi:hypothetical protein
MLLSIATRLGLGAFPIVFLLALRLAHGKEDFDLAAAALNWATYLNILLLGGFALIPPALARQVAGDNSAGTSGDARLVRDHFILCRWLTATGVVVALAMLPLIDLAFPELADRDGVRLHLWYAVMATLLLSQIPLTLWLGVAQALDDYRSPLWWTMLPRAFAVLLIAVFGVAGAPADLSITAVVVVLLVSQAAFAIRVRRRLQQKLPATLDVSDRSALRVLRLNLLGGAVGLVGAGVSIFPVTVVGHVAPNATGAAQVIVGISNAVASLLVAAYFPMSLTLGAWIARPGGLTRYCLRIAVTVASLSAIAALVVSTIPWLCGWLSLTCPDVPAWTAALVLLGAGLRLGALGTQHAGAYARLPQMNLASASAESVIVIVAVLTLVQESGLLALGVAILVGGAARLIVALVFERAWLIRSIDRQAIHG